jgi:hypothetical protein
LTNRLVLGTIDIWVGARYRVANIAKDSADENNKPIARGTTTIHSVKFINELLEVMDLDESSKRSYIAIDNCLIHKSKPIIKKN